MIMYSDITVPDLSTLQLCHVKIMDYYHKGKAFIQFLTIWVLATGTLITSQSHTFFTHIFWHQLWTSAYNLTKFLSIPSMARAPGINIHCKMEVEEKLKQKLPRNAPRIVGPVARVWSQEGYFAREALGWKAKEVLCLFADNCCWMAHVDPYHVNRQFCSLT